MTITVVNLKSSMATLQDDIDGAIEKQLRAKLRDM